MTLPFSANRKSISLAGLDRYIFKPPFVGINREHEQASRSSVIAILTLLVAIATLLVSLG